ncbi:hypothetical protein BLA29_006095 [Euroglyphus maynei]|uniref:Uncharacterized protein n=1 Tax=Euroglyphus maynei TaxID=6958 RepID=A0A1Y3ATZ9_EURMA|nr:hypothetical protein BLA29_006095 [Euroglyphus maynei]
MILERQRKAAEHKANTLAMYDQMARSAPAGGKKTMDIGIYTTGQGKWLLIHSSYNDANNDDLIVTPPSSPSIIDKGLVEDVLQQCKRSAEDRKKKILESYSKAARSGPAGTTTKDDPAQQFIRQRQQEAEQDKKRLLKAYDFVSRQGAGPKQVVLEELKRYDVGQEEIMDDPRFGKLTGTTSFRDGTSK